MSSTGSPDRTIADAIAAKIAVPAVWAMVEENIEVGNSSVEASLASDEGVFQYGETDIITERRRRGLEEEQPWSEFANQLINEIIPDGAVITSVRLTHIHIYFTVNMRHFLVQLFQTSPAPPPPTTTSFLSVILVALPDPAERALQLHDLRAVVLAGFVKAVCENEGKQVVAMEWHVQGHREDDEFDMDDDSISSFSDTHHISTSNEHGESSKNNASIAKDLEPWSGNRRQHIHKYADLLSTCSLLNLPILPSPSPPPEPDGVLSFIASQGSLTISIDHSNPSRTVHLCDPTGNPTLLARDLAKLTAIDEELARRSREMDRALPRASEVLLVASARLQYHFTVLEKARTQLLQLRDPKKTPPLRHVTFTEAILPPGIDTPQCVLDACRVSREEADAEGSGGFLPLKPLLDLARSKALATLQERWGHERTADLNIRRESEEGILGVDRDNLVTDAEALAVAVAALSAQDLSVRRTRAHAWRWSGCGGLMEDEAPTGALRDMERNGGVYLQYAHARMTR
ncbi:hypothetical protein HDU93_008457 [Gonapodya sp. JEL0774]|nr:hypothetical protein HDU93_008457 [Gonapodya sp. JEL0774]